MTNEVPLARPEWNHEDYFREKFKDVTILICQRKTRDLIQLCLTSILNHYPEVKVLVVDGHSEDDSVEWLRFMSAKHSNVKLWERPEGLNSHGQTMDEAMNFIETKYVLLMDSDTIVRRGGFIEGMLEQFSWSEINEEDETLYATGSLMIQSYKGEACAPPIDEADKLNYAHPSCSLYNVEIYRTLRAFTDHGAPCALNNMDAREKGYAIKYFPVDKYVQHLCGASWQEIPTVWNDDGDVQVRPLVTFICDTNEQVSELMKQTNKDFNIVTIGNHVEKKISTYDRGVLETHGAIYDIRFRVNGHYVCKLQSDRVYSSNLIQLIHNEATDLHKNKPVEFELFGLQIYERKHWQKYISIK